MMPLPSARAFLTDLFSSLSQDYDKQNNNDINTTNNGNKTSSSTRNHLKDLRPGAPHRNTLLTLHVLFPNELLPALDLLDRCAVTRVVIASPPASGPRRRDESAGHAAASRGAAEPAAAGGEDGQAASPSRRGQAAHLHHLDGHNLSRRSEKDSDARADRNSTTATAGRSAAPLLLSTRGSEDDDATAAARCHAGRRGATTAAPATGQSKSTNPQAAAVMTTLTGNRNAVAGARNMKSPAGGERGEGGEQTPRVRGPAASRGLAGAPASPRRADGGASCDGYDEDDDDYGRGGRRGELQSRHRRQHADQDEAALLDPQACPSAAADAAPPSPSPQAGIQPARASDPEQGTSPSSSHQNVVFYVRSASTSSSTNHHHHYQQSHNHPAPPIYEVRLSAWHCTCPAFAFAAFPASAPAFAADADAGTSLSNRTSSSTSNSHRSDTPAWSFGGLLRERREKGEQAVPPVCKHLLASLLVEQAPRLFGGGGGADADVDAAAGDDGSVAHEAAADGRRDAGGRLVTQRRLSAPEAAGWAAGWGGL